jgi:hypothetical protein
MKAKNASRDFIAMLARESDEMLLGTMSDFKQPKCRRNHLKKVQEGGFLASYIYSHA